MPNSYFKKKELYYKITIHKTAIYNYCLSSHINWFDLPECPFNKEFMLIKNGKRNINNVDEKLELECSFKPDLPVWCEINE